MQTSMKLPEGLSARGRVYSNLLSSMSISAVLAFVTGANVAHAAYPATSTIANFFDALQDTAFDYLFWLLQYMFPVLVTIAVIAGIWGLVMGIIYLRGIRKHGRGR